MKQELADQVRKSVEQPDREVRRLLSQPRRLFSALAEKEVPEAIGVYLIYDKSGLPIYAGKATDIAQKSSGKPSGLRFRIMHNHLNKAGSDNFLKYLAEDLRVERKLAAQHVKDYCSCQWLSLDTKHEAFLLEHFAIAVLNPRLNRG